MKGGGRVLGFPALLLHYRQEQARRAYILGHQIRTSSTANAPSESTIPATPALGALRERLTEGGHLNPKPQDLEIDNQRRSVARSLSLGPGSRVRVVDPAPSGFTHTVLKLLGYYGKQSRLIRGANTLYSRISSQVNQPELYANFALAQNFRTTHAMLVLYMWLSLCRLRSEGRDGGAMGQSLYDAFNHDLERRIIATGLKVLLSKWMKELEKNFYGAVAAYDKAMRPEAAQDELARALWRNVFAEDDAIMPTGPNSTPVHALARHIRKEAACLALTDSESFLTGNILFSSDFGTVAE